MLALDADRLLIAGRAGALHVLSTSKLAVLPARILAGAVNHGIRRKSDLSALWQLFVQQSQDRSWHYLRYHGVFAYHIPAVEMLSDFADLLPQDHPYIQLHNSIRDTFGGANIIVMAVEVEEGTIFTNETLMRIHRLTEKMDRITNINHNLVTSLTHRNVRKIFLTPDGTIKSQNYFSRTTVTIPRRNLPRSNGMSAPARVFTGCW